MRTGLISIAVSMLAGCATTPAAKSEAPAPAAAPSPAKADSAQAAAARAFAEEFAHKEFAKAAARFDAKMAQALPAERLAEVLDAWAGRGALQSITVVKALEVPGAKGEVVDCLYEQGLMTFVVFFDQEGRISGLRTHPLPKKEKLEALARDYWSLLVAGKWDEAAARWAPPGLSAPKLQAATQEYLGEKGAFKAIDVVSIKQRPKSAGITLECLHEKKSGQVFVAIDGLERVVGLFFRDGWSPADYVDLKAFEERAVTVGVEKYPLPGTLTLPKGKASLPAAILIHGSGPSDRDEAMGPNKTFRDLAWGLASKGVAVLRYEKKTRQYQGEMAEYVKGIEQEYLEDVRSAVDLLAKTPEIDPKRIFLVGHSLGAMVAPKAALDDPRVRGVVLLAGPTRTDGQVHLDQHRYLMDHGWDVPKEQQAAFLAEAEAVAKKLDDPNLKPEDVVDGIEGSYWLDLRQYAKGGFAPKLDVPVLVAQGERDYQVTLVDFDGWKKALEGKKKVAFKLFPGLNHHFMPGTGPSTPQEYDRPNHVAREVIEEVAGFVAGR
ncbi:MAG: alpha/beta fold hydrolase [Myxococcales bacterium]